MELKHQPWHLPLIAWLTSLAATLGSLFFSEVMRLPPCVLCWYQRIALYPLVAIIAVGISAKDARFTKYCWPFVMAGGAIALYHNLLYYRWIPESLSACTEGVPCTTRQIEWLGFISIPFLSLLAFAFIAILLFLFHSRVKRSLS